MGRASYFIAAVFLGLLVGILSAVSALGSYGLVPVVENPAWAEWQVNSSDTKLIYTLGHFLGGGQLPPQKLARSFVRSTDETGARLSSDCVYMLEGKTTPARWWTMSVGHAGGLSTHSVLTAGEAIVDQDDNLSVSISKRPIPGNWIEPEDGNITVEYIINEAPNGETIQFPTITKKGC